MQQVVDDHYHKLKNIADSKERMVAIAYGMPFELVFLFDTKTIR
jgi:hypothetical protein